MEKKIKSNTLVADILMQIYQGKNFSIYYKGKRLTNEQTVTVLERAIMNRYSRYADIPERYFESVIRIGKDYELG